MNRLSIVIFFFLLPCVLFAEKAIRNYTYRQYTTHDGLLQMQLMSAYQDDDGYLWIASKGGVSRFDGKSFKHYTKADGLPNKSVHSAIKIEDQICLVQNFGISFIRKDGQIKTVAYPPGYKTSDMLESHIFFDQKNREIYLFNFDKGNDVNCRFHLSFSLKDSTFRELPLLKGDRIMEVKSNHIFGQSHVYRFDGKAMSKIYTYPFGLCGQVTADVSGNLVYVYAHYKKQIYRISFAKEIEISKISTPPDVGNLYLMSDGRLLAHNSKSKEFIIIDKDRFHPTGIFVTLPTNFTTDQEGNTWVVSEEGAFNLFTLEFESYRFRKNAVDYVWNILEDPSGNMWFGGYGTGLWMMDREGNIVYPKKEQFAPAQKHYNRFYRELTPIERDGEWDWSYLKEIEKHSGLQYMGGCVVKGKLYFPNSNGIFVYENGQFDLLDADCPNAASFYTFYDEEHDRIIASATYFTGNVPWDQRGIVVKDSAGVRYYPGSGKYVVSIGKDRKGNIRIGTFYSDGIWDGNKIVFDTVPSSSNGSVSMKLDKFGALWKGNANGLFVETEEGYRRIEHERLQSEVGSLLIYHDKYLLAVCGYSLFILDLEVYHQTGKTEIAVFDYNNGFDAIESSQNGFFLDSKDYVWIANSNNVIRFNPEILMSKRRQNDPKVSITDVWVSEDNIHFERITDSEFTLNPGKNTLRFEYFSVSFSFPQSLRFRYRLKGLFDEWSEPQSEKQVVFTNLSPGTYQFEVQSSIDGKNWSASAFSPLLNMRKPFWMTGWFIVPSLLLLTGSLYFALRIRQRKQTERLQTEKEVNDLKLRAIRSKSIPHFSGNILSAISYMSMNNYKDTNEYIGLFSDFIKQTLRDSDRSVRPLSEELEYTKKYLRLEKLRFGSKFGYDIRISPEVPENLLVPNMILHTYCENAIRHGLAHKEGSGTVLIDMSVQNSYYVLAVEDDGIGRTEAFRIKTQGTGEGLRIILRQIHVYNKTNAKEAFQQVIDLKKEDGTTQGTRFEFHFPVNYKFVDHV